MSAVKIADLKARLSHHLRAVRAGDTVTVLDRTTPIARVVPMGPEEDVVITPPEPHAPPLAKVKLPRGSRLSVDPVTLLIEDRRRR